MNSSKLYPKLINLLTNRLFLNVLFWIIYALFPLYLNWDDFGSAANRDTDILWYVQAAIIVYINNLFLMPLLFDKKKYGLYSITLISLLIVIEYFSFFIITPLISSYLDHVVNYFVSFFYSLADLVFIVLSLAAGRLMRQYIIQQKNVEKLQQKQTETELAFLKSQVNPHLLFNTLNMIYSHALERSEKVPEMILSLSQNMRYMLYECNEALVPLTKEIQFLKDYIELQRLRIEDRGNISFCVTGNLYELQIAPMLLIGFIENAFKHASQNTINDIEIIINFNIQGTELLAEIKNSYEKSLTTNDLEKDGGIGLQNIKKRLALAYPEKHDLKITEKDDFFKIQLHLELIKTA